MQACPCGFNAPDLHPWSPEWHKLHRDAHLARFPDVDDGTRSNLERMIALAEQRPSAIASAPFMAESMRRVESLIAAANTVCGSNPHEMVSALVGAIITLTANAEERFRGVYLDSAHAALNQVDYLRRPVGARA